MIGIVVYIQGARQRVVAASLKILKISSSQRVTVVAAVSSFYMVKESECPL